MTHFASSSFWASYDKLPEMVRAQADKQFVLLKQNPAHPSLRFKKVGPYWSAREMWESAPSRLSLAEISFGSGLGTTTNMNAGSGVAEESGQAG